MRPPDSTAPARSRPRPSRDAASHIPFFRTDLFSSRMVLSILIANSLLPSVYYGESPMPPLETLFRLEIEFHRRLRTQAPGTEDPRALHTSYALQAGYEPLIRAIGAITAGDLDRLQA